MSKRKELCVNIILIVYLSINSVTGFMEDSTSVLERSSREISTRPLCAAKKDYDFITEYKRLPEHRYVAEYKRFPEYRYSFGIGKRWYDDSKRNAPYSFGIGKRYQMDRTKLIGDYLADENYPEDSKRAVPAPRTYDFGVGKRNVHIFDSIKHPEMAAEEKHSQSEIWEQD